MKKILFLILIFALIIPFNQVIAAEPSMDGDDTPADIVEDLFNNIKTGYVEKDLERIFKHYATDIDAEETDFIAKERKLASSLFKAGDKIVYKYTVKSVKEIKDNVIMAVVETGHGIQKIEESDVATYYINDEKFQIFKIVFHDEDEIDSLATITKEVDSANTDGVAPKAEPVIMSGENLETDPGDERVEIVEDERGEDDLPPEDAGPTDENNQLSDTPIEKNNLIDYGVYK